MKYFISYSEENKTVELWSTKRLPFEPKGWLKDMRDDLRDDLKKLTCSKEEVLYGCYQSTTNETGYDVENILFYNVGNSAFSHLRISEIRFEKIIDSIKSSTVKFEEPITSYSFYKIVPKEEQVSNWKKDQVFASWENLKIISLKDAYSIWCSMKQSLVNIHARTESLKEYGLDISLSLPPNQKFSLPSDAMKKLLDGVICAFHVHNGLNDEQVAMRLSEKVPHYNEKFKKMLQDDSTNLLGKRSIFNLYRESSLLCNPADDLCVYVNINILPSTGEDCYMSGNLFSVC